MSTLAAPPPLDGTIYEALLAYKSALLEKEEARVRGMGKKGGKRAIDPRVSQEEGFAAELNRVETILARGLAAVDKPQTFSPQPGPKSPEGLSGAFESSCGGDDEPFWNPFTGEIIYPDREKYFGGPSRTHGSEATTTTYVPPAPKREMAFAFSPTSPIRQAVENPFEDPPAPPQMRTTGKLVKPRTTKTSVLFLEDEGDSVEFPTPGSTSKAKEKAKQSKQSTNIENGSQKRYSLEDFQLPQPPEARHEPSYTYTKPPPTRLPDSYTSHTRGLFPSPQFDEDDILDPTLMFAPDRQSSKEHTAKATSSISSNPDQRAVRSGMKPAGVSTVENNKDKTPPDSADVMAFSRATAVKKTTSTTRTSQAPKLSEQILKDHEYAASLQTEEISIAESQFPGAKKISSSSSMAQFFKDREYAQSLHNEETRAVRSERKNVAGLANRQNEKDISGIGSDREMALKLQKQFELEERQIQAESQRLRREYQDSIEAQAKYEFDRTRSRPRNPTATSRRQSVGQQPLGTPFRQQGIRETTPKRNAMPKPRIVEISEELDEERDIMLSFPQIRAHAEEAARQRTLSENARYQISAQSQQRREEAIRRRDAEQELVRKDKEYARAVAQEEKRKRAEAARTSRITTCIVCTDTIDIDMAIYNCIHPYCQDCIASAFDIAVKTRTPFKCCGKQMDLVQVNHIVPKKTRDAYSQLLLELSTPNPIYCASRKCGKFIPPADIDGDVGNCFSCLQRTCRHCKNPAHAGLCKEDTESQRIIQMGKKAGWKQCTGCGHMCERIDGCLHMTCPRCHAEFCYNCGKPYSECGTSRCSRT